MKTTSKELRKRLEHETPWYNELAALCAELLERIEAVEQVAHAPQPIVTTEEFEAHRHYGDERKLWSTSAPIETSVSEVSRSGY